MRLSACLATVVALVLALACRTTRTGPPAAPSPEGAVVQPGGQLVLDLGAREVIDLQPLVGGVDPRYLRTEDRPGWTLRLREGFGGPGPLAIQSVDVGSLSRLALLRVGELDAADLGEDELAALDAGTAVAPALHRFSDFERVVLRFGPGLSPPERRGLWRAADAAGVATVLFPRTGALALTCLPGRLASPPPPAATELPPGPLAVLVLEGRPGLEAVARRVAAAWSASGTSAFARALPWPLLRDRLLAGRYDVAVLALDRTAVPPEAVLATSLPRWACADPPAVADEPEELLRSACGLYPLVALDRVVAARPGVLDLTFDDRGRVRWGGVRPARREDQP